MGGGRSGVVKIWDVETGKLLRVFAFLALFALLAGNVLPRQDPATCGTYRVRTREQLHLHRRAAVRAAAAADFGNIAVLQDAGDIVASPNQFNLDRQTLALDPTAPNAAQYQFQLTGSSFDASAATAGVLLSGLGDDDTRSIALPFAFPFFGANYRRVFVNSDGNLTFSAGDTSSGDRSLGALTAGPPRIAVLYEDLNPSQSSAGVSVLAAADRFVVSWVNVPEYADFGVGSLQTFQVRLFPNGRIEFAYQGVFSQGAVVGISPGGLQGTPSVVSFYAGNSGEYVSTVAERFGTQSEIDVVAAAQRFYQTHDDSYDYLAFYNNMGVSAGPGAVSWELTVSNTGRSGFGDDQPADFGQEFGSAGRLQAVLNLGPIGQYPDDPGAFISQRPTTHDTPTTIFAHEAGHLFLAYASVRDPQDATARPMLGHQNAHWNFAFDSEASLLEGNRIQDNGAAVSPRFLTVGITEAYSPLDQYLMGFRAAEEVPPVFLVTSPTTYTLDRLPQLGVAFDGGRRDVAVPELIQAEGRRTPDYTVSQRRFRVAVILIVAAGAPPSMADLAKADSFRQSFETFYPIAASNRAVVETTLLRSLRLSTFPAAGILQGASITGSVALAKPATAPLTVQLASQSGFVTVAKTVTIQAGANSASFPITGVTAGVDELVATPSDPSQFETPHARIQVAASTASLKLSVVSGDNQTGRPGVPFQSPVVFQVTDINNLPYPGVRVRAATARGNVTPAITVTDDAGKVRFQWTPGALTDNKLTAALDDDPSISATAVAAVSGPTRRRP